MDKSSNCCDKRAAKYEGVGVNQLDWLAPHVQQVSIDGMRWVSTYRCTICGQVWEERYRATGHGEVPDVFKIESQVVA
jgi:hypothetical protein